MTRSARTRAAVLASALALASCAPAARPGVPAAPLPTSRIQVVAGADTTALTVEVARTVEQAEAGLMDRDSLAADAGLLFLFDPPRAADDGFWMWRTRFALDLAVLDAEGTILAILGMEPCTDPDPDGCPGYIPGVEHSAALEVNRGWFARNGVEVGDRVRLPDR